jgi:hypothetical protein
MKYFEAISKISLRAFVMPDLVRHPNFIEQITRSRISVRDDKVFLRWLLITFLISIPIFSYSQTPTELADLQLKGYNERNIELFLQSYSDSVKVYNFPNQFLYEGKETMRQNYAGMFTNLTDLHCTLKSRVVIGNTVIDEEQVVIRKGQPDLHAVAIYKVAHGKIQEVYFIVER